jgi:hypothetical protein
MLQIIIFLSLSLIHDNIYRMFLKFDIFEKFSLLYNLTCQRKMRKIAEVMARKIRKVLTMDQKMWNLKEQEQFVKE